MTDRDQPTCWIIAGPNGAGKTMFALKYLPAMGWCASPSGCGTVVMTYLPLISRDAFSAA